MTVEQERAASPLLADSISSIKTSALRFFSGTALSRITGMLRDIILAYCFGTHAALAALFVAFRLSHVCRRLFGEGALQSAFIPVFEELRKESSHKAFYFFRDLSCLMTLFLLAFIACTMLGLGTSLHFIDWSGGNREIVSLMIILMPSLLFICLFGLNSSLLQCQKRYFTVGIAPAFFNILIAAGSLLFRAFDPYAAMPYVAIFIVVGCLMQWVVTFVPALRAVRQALSQGLTTHIRIFSQDIRRLAGPLALGLLGVGATQINTAIDALFARWADPQGPAQLWYAMRLLQLPLALFGIALSGALLPPLSRSIQAGRQEEYMRFLNFALRRVSALLVPCTAGLYIFGTPLINCIYGRGDFHLDSILTTCGCLHGYAMGLLPMGLMIVLAPAFYAYKDFKTPAWAAFFSLGSNLLLNCLFIFVFEMQAVSVALATSISSWFNVCYLYWRLQRHFGPILTTEGRRQGINILFATTAAAAAAWLFESAFFLPPSLFSCFTALQEGLPTNFIEQIITLAVPATFFLFLLSLLAWLLNCEDLLVLFRLKKEARDCV